MSEPERIAVEAGYIAAVAALVEALNRQSASGLITRDILTLTNTVQQMHLKLFPEAGL